jgi:hypothetical protein
LTIEVRVEPIASSDVENYGGNTGTFTYQILLENDCEMADTIEGA